MEKRKRSEKEREGVGGLIISMDLLLGYKGNNNKIQEPDLPHSTKSVN